MAVKSLVGGTYAATQNPTGAIVKASQNAATQPPTVIIQATGGGPVFNYTTDCYLLTFPGIGGNFLGAGKLDASNSFTGLVGQASFGGGDHVIGVLLGYKVFAGDSTGSEYYGSCGAAPSCLIADTYSYNKMYTVISMPTASRGRCYP